MEMPKNGWARTALTVILTALVTWGISALVTFGQDRRTIVETRERLDEHLKVAAEKITQLEDVRNRQSTVEEHIRSIDENIKDVKSDMKDIKQELKELRKSR